MSDPSLFGMVPQRPPAPGAGPWRQPPFIANTKADATGTAVISMPSVPGGQAWVLERVNISANSSSQPLLSMYDGADLSSALFLDGSTTGNGDVDDRSVLVLYPGNQLTLVWTGASVGAICRCRIQYHVEAIGT